MLKPSLQLRIGQQLTMTPQLQQAIRLLQLPSLDLQAHVRETLETNVMLEAEEEALDAAPEVVRERNFYREGDVTHYGQTVKDADRIQTIWTQLLESSAFTERRSAMPAADPALGPGRGGQRREANLAV